MTKLNLFACIYNILQNSSIRTLCFVKLQTKMNKLIEDLTTRDWFAVVLESQRQSLMTKLIGIHTLMISSIRQRHRSEARFIDKLALSETSRKSL